MIYHYKNNGFVKTKTTNAAELEARCAKQQAQLDAQTTLLVDQGNLALDLKEELKVWEARRATVRYGKGIISLKYAQDLRSSMPPFPQQQTFR